MQVFRLGAVGVSLGVRACLLNEATLRGHGPGLRVRLARLILKFFQLGDHRINLSADRAARRFTTLGCLNEIVEMSFVDRYSITDFANQTQAGTGNKKGFHLAGLVFQLGDVAGDRSGTFGIRVEHVAQSGDAQVARLLIERRDRCHLVATLGQRL